MSCCKCRLFGRLRAFCFLSNRIDGVQTAISVDTFRIEGVLEAHPDTPSHGRLDSALGANELCMGNSSDENKENEYLCGACIGGGWRQGNSVLYSITLKQPA